MYLKRSIDIELLAWTKEDKRKPLLVRGARQVGKSFAVRHLGEQFKYFVEINFEQHKQASRFFDGDLSPQIICENLSLLYKIPIIPGETLLFFDEIQACIPAISSLRFFYEQYPELHLIAAGSLLEFALFELPSFGVGRIRSLFMYPFSFDEFLRALGETQLADTKSKANPENPLIGPIHDKLLDLLKRFMILGGMPAVVASFVSNGDVTVCERILDDLIFSFKIDFAKYKKRVPVSRISEVFESVVQQSGGRFAYSKAATEATMYQVKQSLELLIMAGVVIPVTHTSANGIPLGAEVNTKKRKMLLFDTGIFQRILGLNISDVLFSDDFSAVNKGAIAEILVGLELQKSDSCYHHNDLYFWQREALNSQAEIDYLIQSKGKVLPVEVKSGNKGSMQSLHLFLKEKKAPFGIRCSIENFSSYENIKVAPLYAVPNILNL